MHRTLAMSTRVASRIVGDAEAVSDVLQDAYLNVYRSLERFRGASRYETWVYRIVVNAARSHLRRMRRMRARETVLDEAEIVPARSGEVLEAADLVAQHIDVVALLARLGEADRELLTLRYLAGLSVAQVAAELGASENAIKVRLHRARRRLLALLAADEEFDDEGAVRASVGSPKRGDW
ncbi:RNA polymerase, sigma-24 subunit, ECF subfamily [Acidimicrobium ferrooxidans DSM 10331]|uniref:RNA polymerase, sigma-24 subunit, ECF subfamily n=1 Tax=Acidimicrobium ferrooxidans (strain DSM 10331 / JCM 15462 / NBRC 103882 / ICP) TaxID=525909 RepID=C7M2V8_ACIFD|nr:sigma-70 family RNA polymerase sigma factor [Acidimicrobium ferrooxidans]ACU53352.1 RNA polymerase, sigma-24 subunit, ECF subfamily [Acidimicrobium ferrooxidans DSM 10331]